MSALANVDKAILAAKIRLELLRAQRADLLGDAVAQRRCHLRMYVLERQRQAAELEVAESSALSGEGARA